MPETFQPELNGWHLQRGYSIEPLFPVAEDRRELGNVRSIALADKALRCFRGLRWHADNRAPAEYVQSFFRRLHGPAGRFYWLAPEFVPSPDKAPTLTVAAGGAQGSRTVFVKFAWRNATGTTLPSPAATIAVPANELLTVRLESYPPGVTDAVIYATQDAAGTEVEQTVLTSVQTWTQPDTALLVLTEVPVTANTAKETITARLLESYSLTRLQGLTYELALELEESYT